MDERRPSFFQRPCGHFPSKTTAILVIGTLFLVFPLTFLLWLTSTIVSSFYTADIGVSREIAITISPSRWFIVCLVPISFALHCWRQGSVSYGGAVSSLFVGFILAFGSYPFVVCLLTFFLSGSQATKFRANLKKTFDKSKSVRTRDWIQVLCNCGPATLLAIFYLSDCGIGELPIDFCDNYRASWLSAGILGSFAAACGDTLSSELGSVVDSQTYLITSWQPVPHGTNGGVSILGLFFGFFGGSIIGFSYLLTLFYTVDGTLLERAPSQWPIVLVGGVAGLIGSVIDSFIGAIFQYSGKHKVSGAIVERAGENIIHINGREILDNQGVDLLSTIAMGIITPNIANSMCR